MKKTISVMITALFLLNEAKAQDTGVSFETDSSWAAIKEIAKAEQKYIFVDCYATWCGPCLEMDQNVYPDEQIGIYVNKHFISIKVQMDSTVKDNAHVRSWYADANLIHTQYAVRELPTFLFFSPDGNLVHRGSGFQSVADFQVLCSKALDPAQQFYTLLHGYQHGARDYSKLPALLQMAEALHEDALVNILADDYKDNYLMKLPENQLYTPEHLDFIGSHLESSNDPAFRLFYPDGRKVDQVVGSNYSRRVTDYLISKEEVNSKFNEYNNNYTQVPNWKSIAAAINKKYGKDYAQRTILNAKIDWYSNKSAQHEASMTKRDWSLLSTYCFKKLIRDGIDTSGIARLSLNNLIFNVIFMHSDNKTQLNQAIKWMEALLVTNSTHVYEIDTYASLLYKVGRVSEAKKWEGKAVEIEEEEARLNNRKPDGEFSATLNKMNKGQTTWSSN